MYYYRNSSGGHRHPRHIYGFPWFLFIVLFFSFHSLTWILVSVGIMLLLNFFIRSMVSNKPNTGATANNMGAQQPYYQPYQPYQQQYQPYYQAQAPYQQPSYEQGYQATQENRNEGAQQYQYPETVEYDQYEQPQAQYPEQMPPMQQ